MPNPRGNPNISKYGNRFSKENQPDHKPGPKPSRIRAYIQENDLSTNDVSAAIRALAEMSAKELKAVYDDDDAPVLLRGFAIAIMTEMKRGGLLNIEALLNRALGKPKESVEHTVTGPITVQLED